MPAQILVVDSVATNRIVLKVKLAALRYAVSLAASIEEAEARISDAPPDLVICTLSYPESALLDRLNRLRRVSEPDSVPILVLGAFAGPEARIACLAAGADDLLPMPAQDVVLFARIRALLRSRATEGEAALQHELERALGLAEDEEPFEGAPRVTLAGSPERSEALSRALPGCLRKRRLDEVLGDDPGAASDLFVIDAGPLEEPAIASEVFRLLVDLRSRETTRHAAQLLILPDTAEELAGMGLDLGADDIVHASVSAEELRLRAQRLLNRKRRQDSLRISLQAGLRAAVTDPLTGLYNRRYAMPCLDRITAEEGGGGPGFAVLLLDLDHFKRVNDRWGHGTGDRVLTEVADRLRGALRRSDLAARMGGEEFLVLLPGANGDAACETAQRLRRLIEATPFAGKDEITLTVSIGVALGGQEGGLPLAPETLLERADRALYEAKHAGRNRISLSAA